MNARETAGEKKRILVTGSAGNIGQAVAPVLVARGHEVRGFDRARTPGLADVVVGDLTDREAVRKAVSGMDTVIHLGAEPDEADFLSKLPASTSPRTTASRNRCESSASSPVLPASVAVEQGGEVAQAFWAATVPTAVAPSAFKNCDRVISIACSLPSRESLQEF